MSQTTEFNLASPSFKADPYPTFAWLRTHDPIHAFLSTGNQTTWLITRHKDAEILLRDDRFVKDRQHVTSPDFQAHQPSAGASAADLMDMSIVDFDPPDHTRLRFLLHPFFTPRQIEQWLHRAQDIVDELIDAGLRQGSMDLIEEFAAVLPLRMISEMLGVPVEDGQFLHQWTKQIADSLGDPVASQRVGGILQQFYTYLLALVSQKRRMPADDIVSKLLQVEVESGKISEREIVTTAFILITAGHDTADNLIGNGVLALLMQPEQMALLRETPTLIKTAVEEFARYRSPFMLTTMRWSREDIVLHDKQIRRGDSVLISLASANRDSEVFAEPDRLNIARQDNPHLAFGKGIHYCLGAPLARLEGQVAISSLLRRVPDFRLLCEPEELEWRPGWLVQGLQHLPVMF